MKGYRIGFSCLFFAWMLSAVAQVKVVEKPHFLGSNTSLEIRRVTLYEDSTVLEADFYARALGDEIRVDSSAVLVSAGKRYALKGTQGISTDRVRKISGGAKVSMTLTFFPLPVTTETFDFLEEVAGGWKVMQVYLDGQKPEMKLPEHLVTHQLDYERPLPEAVPCFGKFRITVRFLGEYSPGSIRYQLKEWGAWFLPYPVEAKDGVCVINDYLTHPGLKTIFIGKHQFSIFVVPGSDVTMTVDYHALQMADTHLFADEYKEVQKVWFEGDYDGLNTILADDRYQLDVTEGLENIGTMSVEELKRKSLAYYESMRQKIADDVSLSIPVKQLLQLELKAKTFSNVSSAKYIIAYSPRGEGQKRGDLTEGEHFRDEILAMDSIRSAGMMMTTGYEVILEQLEKVGLVREEYAWCKDLRNRDLKQISDRLGRMMPLPDSLLAQVDELHTPAIREYIYAKHRDYTTALATDTIGQGYTVCQLDTALRGEAILQAIATKHKERIVLIDFWATWCGPCRRAMKMMEPMKDSLKAEPIDYVFLTDESSPKVLWKKMIADVHGEHYYLSDEQHRSLMQLYGFEGIPAYLILGKNGEVVYQHLGFPGMEEMMRQLREVLHADRIKPKYLIDGLFFSELPSDLDRRSYNMAILRNEKGEKTIFITGVALSEESKRYAIPMDKVCGADDWLKRASQTTRFVSMATANTPLKLQPGDAIGTFRLTDTKGRVWTEQSTLGKPLVLNFWYTGCGPCIKEMPELSTWLDICPEVNYLAVTWNTAEDIQRIVERRKFRFVQVPDAMDMFQKFGVGPTPLTVVVDRKGIIRKMVEGTSRQKRDELLECVKLVEKEK